MSNEQDTGNVLIIADSDHHSDLYYATRFLVPDPMIYVELSGERLLLVKDLEFGRAIKEASVDRVVPIGAIDKQLRKEGKPATNVDLLDRFLADRPERRFRVPEDFPVGHADRLRQLGYTLDVAKNLFPGRAIKTEEEIELIAHSQRVAEGCMDIVIDAIRRSEIRADQLILDGAPLTSERLRAEGRKYLLDQSYFAELMIIASGDQACDPHDTGSGPISPHQTVIIDIFPRSLDHRYWGDMTRTIVRGEASEEIHKLYRDVHECQASAIEMLRPGRNGKDVHQHVVDFFAERGYVTEERDGTMVGYFHGTGHGVGLDIHESPSLGRVDSELVENHVVTVEPGLYYPGLGGVRIEDTVVITADGCRNLNRYPKELEV